MKMWFGGLLACVFALQSEAGKPYLPAVGAPGLRFQEPITATLVEFKLPPLMMSDPIPEPPPAVGGALTNASATAASNPLPGGGTNSVAQAGQTSQPTSTHQPATPQGQPPVASVTPPVAPDPTGPLVAPMEPSVTQLMTPQILSQFFAPRFSTTNQAGSIAVLPVGFSPAQPPTRSSTATYTTK